MEYEQILAILADTEPSETPPLQIEAKKATVLDKQEVRAVMSSTTVRLTRKELYEEIWKISVAGVSQKYGIPYAKCLAKIKAAQIPVPPSGYWTKLNFGKSVE